VKVAVVRNRSYKGVIGKLGAPCQERYGRGSVQSVINALRAGGHTVAVFEGDITLFDKLMQFMPPEPSTGIPAGMVFNMAYGIQGESRYTHIPSMLEMSGVPYTGPSPFCHTVALDKVLTKLLMQLHGIPTPNFRVLDTPDGNVDGMKWPFIVKPRRESTSLGLRLVHNKTELAEAVNEVLVNFQQSALVEEYIDGREVAVALLGNDPVEVLPIVELDYGDREVRIMTKPDKFHKTGIEPTKVCPAPLGDAKTEELRKLSVALFHLTQCRDYTRLDIRLDKEGNPFVLEINSMATLGGKGGLVMAARTGGYNFKQLVWRILDVAHYRYFNCPAPRGINEGELDRYRRHTETTAGLESA
jgi:D-alanine-D-alanine ligase